MSQQSGSESSEGLSETGEDGSDSDLESGRTERSTNPLEDCCSRVMSWAILTMGCLTLVICLPIWLIICCPCLCLCCMLRGRSVRIDGTGPLDVDAETMQGVEEARNAKFQPQLQSFTSQSLLPSSTPPMRTTSSQVIRAVDRAWSGLRIPFVHTNSSKSSVDAPLLDEKRKRMIHLRLEMCEDSPGSLNLRVDREDIVQQSLRCLTSVPPVELLASRLSVAFDGGFGLDAGGLARDWFDSVGLNMNMSAENGDGHMNIWPDKTLAPRPHEDRFMDLCAIGRLLGLAVWFEIPVPLSLSSVMCKFILRLPISPVDVQQLDPDFYQFRVLPVCKQGGVAELEAALGEPLTFMSAATDLRESQELCPGGTTKRVTESNKLEYIKLLCEYHVCGGMKQQINVFLKGFWDIFPEQILKATELTHRELSILITGVPALDVTEWRLHTSVTQVGASSQEFPIEWFWEVVEELSSEDRAKLLHFITGSSRLPARGFESLSPKLSISVSGDVGHLPQAHTCANNLVLPPYASKGALREKLKIALSHDQGFGFM